MRKKVSECWRREKGRSVWTVDRPFNPSVTPQMEVFFRALGDEVQLRTLVVMAIYGESTVIEISRRLGVLPSKVSYGLAVLNLLGVVERRREGKFYTYDLDPTGLEELVDHLIREGGNAC